MNKDNIKVLKTIAIIIITIVITIVIILVPIMIIIIKQIIKVTNNMYYIPGYAPPVQ